MIDNVILLITGTLHERDTNELLDKCHPLGMFDAIATLRVDGGMAANNWLLQFLSDMINVPVERPACIETSALGAAYLAGLQTGVYSSLGEIARLWEVNASFKPEIQTAQREHLYAGWQNAMERTLTKHHSI